MTLLLVYATVSIFFSFLCSILEAVLLSVSGTFINLKKKEGHSYAVVLERLKKDVDKPLIAILTLNTIAHTVGAILVGVQAEQLPYKIEFLGINIVGITTILYLPAAFVSVPISINPFSVSFNSPTHVTLFDSLNPALNCTTHNPSLPHGDCADAGLDTIISNSISK